MAEPFRLRTRVRRAVLAVACAALAAGAASAQDADADRVLRARFEVDLEPVSSTRPGDPYPLDAPAAHRRALEEAARVFAAMVYGWRFGYRVGDKARGAAEEFDLEPLGELPFGDARLSVTDADSGPSVLGVWAEYRLDADQARAYAAVRQGSARRSQGTGSAPLSAGQQGRAEALRDAARLAVRALLAGSERNRPKEAYGTAVLEEPPRYWVDEGRWVCSARFRIAVDEIVHNRYF